jgi:hypothetical protein
VLDVLGGGESMRMRRIVVGLIGAVAFAALSACSSDGGGESGQGAQESTQDPAKEYAVSFLAELKSEPDESADVPDLHVDLKWTGGTTNPIPLVGSTIEASYTIGDDKDVVYRLSGSVAALDPPSPNGARVVLDRGEAAGAFDLTARRVADFDLKRSHVDFPSGRWTSPEGERRTVVGMTPIITVVTPGAAP